MASNKPIRFAFAALAVLFIAALLAPALQSARWGGHTSLELQFQVTDVATRQPIPNARIDFVPEHGENSFCGEQTSEPFTLIADNNGIALRRTNECPCGGSEGWFEDTFSINLPGWSYRVSADGYAGSPKLQLRTNENCRNVKRGPPHATAKISVSLTKHP